MIEYLKMIVVALVTAITAPLTVSSAAHYNFFASVTGLAVESERLSFYYNVFMCVFSLVILLVFRRTVIKGFRLAFKSGSKSASDKVKDKKFFIKNVIFSLLPTVILFVPVAEGKLLMDYIDSFFNVNGLILAGMACIVTACVLVVALWYTSKSKNPVRRSVDKRTIMRLSFYQLPCYVIPGFSHIASGAVNLFISDIASKSLMSQLYIYLAPSMFFVSFTKVIRLLTTGIILDPVLIVIGAVVFALVSRLVIGLTLKFNVRRLFAFFAAYSAVFGIFISIISFFIK